MTGPDGGPMQTIIEFIDASNDNNVLFLPPETHTPPVTVESAPDRPIPPLPPVRQPEATSEPENISDGVWCKELHFRTTFSRFPSWGSGFFVCWGRGGGKKKIGKGGEKKGIFNIEKLFYNLPKKQKKKAAGVIGGFCF
ncbi:MAG: hypothetical protein IPK21_22570 [Haliscomenobacter sp.]|nr:hypothetical protein [Haliscomenobacter sp.]